MKHPPLSRLAQLRNDLNFALALLVLGVVFGAFSFIPQPHTASSEVQIQPAINTQ